MNQTELLKHQAAQDQAQIHNLQLRLAKAITQHSRAILRAEKAEAELKTLSDEYQATCAASNATLDRMEKAEAELKELHEQQPLLHIQFSDCGAHIRFWTRSKQRMQEQQAAAPKSPMVTLYASPIPAAPSTLHCDAARVLAAWDGTVLPKSHDGRLQQEMECLRESLKAGRAPIPPEWIASVTASRDQFLRYADLHRAKDTRDGYEKARVNQHNADVLTALLERASTPAQTPAVTTAEWREVMQELADDAEFACDIQYPYRSVYPGDMVKYRAEMAIVRRARGLLERAK